MSWHQVFGPGGPVLDSLDLRDRGVLGAVAHGAPVAPPRPAPEGVAHYTRRFCYVTAELERVRLQLWAYQQINLSVNVVAPGGGLRFLRRQGGRLGFHYR